MRRWMAGRRYKQDVCAIMWGTINVITLRGTSVAWPSGAYGASDRFLEQAQGLCHIGHEQKRMLHAAGAVQISILLRQTGAGINMEVIHALADLDLAFGAPEHERWEHLLTQSLPA